MTKQPPDDAPRGRDPLADRIRDQMAAIEREAVPERLAELARELQRLLAEERSGDPDRPPRDDD
ncbi:hypothetical protein [Marivita sp. GX14005]|uniref:hypothetical protein n=1 Tax=Marivita sp. GX14005 TaxID=2942276 RepID=UPI0020195F32|nr:hypothetical protein [Marivita sp. GX14005]MCL3883731.1 hypothetical protein [Marivita sp. GX14005]